MSGAARYLRYEEREPCPAGLEHQLRNLKWLLAEAHLSGRIAERSPLNLDPRHNFGVQRHAPGLATVWRQALAARSANFFRLLLRRLTGRAV